MHNCYLCHRPVTTDDFQNFQLKCRRTRSVQSVQTNSDVEVETEWVHRECIETAERLLDDTREVPEPFAKSGRYMREWRKKRMKTQDAIAAEEKRQAFDA